MNNRTMEYGWRQNKDYEYITPVNVPLSSVLYVPENKHCNYCIMYINWLKMP